MRLIRTSLLVLSLASASFAAAQISVPEAPPAQGAPQVFHDTHYGVRFQVPPGWDFAKKDHELSTFRLDAPTATGKSEVRGVATLAFNPYPLSTLSGALFYYSVERHVKDAECARQAVVKPAEPTDKQQIGGMSFVHGHDEHGGICIESRDDVYTAYRKGSCYRFDLEVHTFCSISSGAMEITDRQMADIEERMDGILSSVVLDWEHSVEPTRITPQVPQPATAPANGAPPVSESKSAQSTS